MDGPTFDVRLLGRFVVLRDGEEVPASAFGGRLSRRLVRMLASRRGEHVSKDALAEALWPRRAPSDPVANLEVLVSRARRALGDATLLLTGPGGYAFSPDPRCRLDAEELLAALELGRERSRQGDLAGALSEFDRAVGRWGGEPLAEDLYEDWSVPFRARLHEAYEAALEGGAEAALAVGDPRRAVELAGMAAFREPLRESSALLLVRALAAAGDRAGALEAFERFRTRLAEELGLDPSEEASALQASVLRGDAVGPGAVSVEGPAPLAPEPVLPFVDRVQELSVALDRANRVVHVAGPSGSGKSRFLDEVARRAGVPVLRACAFPPERDEPWSLARSVLREALALDALAARSLPELSAAALLDVLPELADLREGRRAMVDRQSRRALAVEGARALLETAAGDGAMLLLDDAQWADETSLFVLAAASARVESLGLVVATRSEEVRESDPSASFLDELRRGGSLTEIELGRLPGEALESLAGDSVVVRAIEEETTAMPLVVAEVLRLLEERGALGAETSGRRRPLRPIAEDEAREAARSGERRALEARVSRLGERERLALTALAALGREASAATVGAAVGADPAAALAALDALTHAGLARLGDRGWAPVHDAIAEVVTSSTEPGRRVLVHAALAGFLEEQGAEPSEVAAHLEGAGQADDATKRYADAAELALGRFATEECLRLTEAALRLGPTEETGLRVLAARAEARARAGDLDGAKADLRDALARTRNDPARADLLTRLAVLESGSEDYQAARDLLELALAAAGEDPRRRAEVHAAGSIVDLNLGDLARSESRAKIALELFEANGDARGAAGILDGRAMATFLGGRIREAADAFDRVARLFRDAGELLRVGTPRSTRGHALVFLARAEEGLGDVMEALALERELGHAEGESYALWHEAEALAALGRGEEAVDSAAAALAIAERIRHREWTAASLRGLGIALESTGTIDEAIDAHRRGLAASEGLPLFETWAAARLASCLVRAGRLDEAEDALSRARPELAPLGAYECRLAEAELRAARGADDTASFAADAAEIAEDGGHVASAIRLRGLGSGQPSA
jgi:DNA-binding SARP family transcriptional activator